MAACPAARIWSSSSTASRRLRTGFSRRTSASTICTRKSFSAISRAFIFAQTAPTAAFPRFHGSCCVRSAHESNLLSSVSQRLPQGSQRTGFRPHGRFSLPSRAQNAATSTTLPRICFHRSEIEVFAMHAEHEISPEDFCPRALCWCERARWPRCSKRAFKSVACPARPLRMCPRTPGWGSPLLSARARRVQETHRLGRRPEKGGIARATKPASVRPLSLVPTRPGLAANTV